MKSDKNGSATKAFILWFYEQFYGYRPDATVYRRHIDRKNMAALIHVFEPQAEDVESVSPTDAAELIYYLEDAGVYIDGPNIILYPGLVAAYINRKHSERAKKALKEAVDFLVNGKNKEPEFRAPEGW